MSEVLTRKYHAALWQMGADGKYRMTDLYAELFHQYLTGQLSQKRFLQRTGELEAIYDGLRGPF